MYSSPWYEKFSYRMRVSIVCESTEYWRCSCVERQSDICHGMWFQHASFIHTSLACVLLVEFVLKSYYLLNVFLLEIGMKQIERSHTKLLLLWNVNTMTAVDFWRFIDWFGVPDNDRLKSVCFRFFRYLYCAMIVVFHSDMNSFFSMSNLQIKPLPCVRHVRLKIFNQPSSEQWTQIHVSVFDSHLYLVPAQLVAWND